MSLSNEPLKLNKYTKTVRNPKREHSQEMERIKDEHQGEMDLSEKRKLRVIEYGINIQKLEKELKENQQGTHALDIVKEEASRDNEELREAQKMLLHPAKCDPGLSG
jgi:hypothetical protein